MSEYVWITTGGDEVPLRRTDVEAFALINEYFPGSEAILLRLPGNPPKPLFRSKKTKTKGTTG